MIASPFEEAVALAAEGQPGRYRAKVDPGWSGPVAPNGGLLAAIMVRAVEVELGPGAPPPRTVAAHYLDVPASGPVLLTVEVLRRGRRVAACEVRMFSHERLVCQSTVLASATRPDQLPLRRDPPPSPSAGEAAPLAADQTPGAPAMLGRMELRPTFGPPMFSGREPAETGGWASIRGDGRPLDAARLCALCDLWWPPLYGRLKTPAALPTVQLTVHLRDTSGLVNPPVLARFTTTTVDEGHLEERGELWSAEGRLLAESLQLALLVLD